MSELLKKLSVSLKLEHTYTNHSLRATFVTAAADAGLSNQEIMAVTDHRAANFP